MRKHEQFKTRQVAGALLVYINRPNGLNYFASGIQNSYHSTYAFWTD